MDWAIVLSGLGFISAALLGWTAKARIVKQDAAADANRDAALRSDVAHIRHTIDEMRIELRAQGVRYDALAERVTRVEESVKQAHHRINRLEDDQ